MFKGEVVDEIKYFDYLRFKVLISGDWEDKF